MGDYTLDQVGFALRNLGRYRVRRAQSIANEGEPDGISGARMLALGLRETGLRNINGGASWDGHAWVPTKSDKGWLQISSEYHQEALAQMPAVQEGTWTPVVRDGVVGTGVCPRFTDALRFTLDEFHEAIAYADDHGVPEAQLVHFATAAHNAGKGGALSGYKAGDVDKYTAHGDYSAWVERHRALIKRWLSAHDSWRV